MWLLLSKALKTAQLEIEMLLDFFQKGPPDMPRTKHAKDKESSCKHTGSDCIATPRLPCPRSVK